MSSNKLDTILSVLKAGRSLNRFQAEHLGDHVLPSTIAALRAKGYLILGQPEKVATRFGKSVRVMRYSYIGLV